MSGDLGLIAESTDGGLSWTSKNFQLTTTGFFDIKEVPNTSTVVAVGRQRTIGSGRCFVRPIGVTAGARSTLG